VDEAGAAVGGHELAGEEGAGLGIEPAEVVHGVASDRAGEVGAVIGFAQPVTEQSLGVFGYIRLIQESEPRSLEEGFYQVKSDKVFAPVGRVEQPVRNVRPI